MVGASWTATYGSFLGRGRNREVWLGERPARWGWDVLCAHSCRCSVPRLQPGAVLRRRHPLPGAATRLECGVTPRGVATRSVMRRWHALMSESTLRQSATSWLCWRTKSPTCPCACCCRRQRRTSNFWQEQSRSPQTGCEHGGSAWTPCLGAQQRTWLGRSTS